MNQLGPSSAMVPSMMISMIVVSLTTSSTSFSGSDSSAGQEQTLNCTIGGGDQQGNATCVALELLTSQLGFIPASWGTQFGPPCFWPGITCASLISSQIVIALQLNCPFTISAVPQLPSFEGFPFLQNLSLPSCRLYGTLPVNWSWTLPLLQNVDLHSNELSGTLPVEWGNMTELQTLSLIDNRFIGTLPPEWGNLTAMSYIDLSLNYLNGTLPKEWSTMRNLNTLYLYTNRLTGNLPAAWSSLSALQVLDGSDNRLNGTLPPEWGNATALVYLSLSSNQLTGNLPPEWSTLSALQQLSLRGNLITGTLPTAWANLSALQGLFLDGNQVSGTLPPEWGSLVSIQYLSLYANNLMGTLPVSWGNMISIIQLFLENSQFNGTLPREWSQMSGIHTLRLHSSQLTGTLPPEWVNMMYLETLSLHSNQLTGTLPPEWGNMTQIDFLNLHSNQLTGTLPPEWSNMNRLFTLSLESNQLSGGLPTEWGNLSVMLFSLKLSSNKLTGTLPPEWRTMARLHVLNLFSNQLTGTLPEEWGHLPAVSSLALSSNALTGTLPQPWIMIPSLKVLDLSINRLSGTLPALNGTHLQELRLGENYFTGGIEPFSAMTNLQVLDVSHNHLSTFPPQLSQWAPNLVAFLGSNNNFRGTLPRGIVNHSLCALDVSGNKLQGSTDPTSTSYVDLGNWLQLWVLSISGNDWSGPAVYFNSSVKAARVAPCQAIFGYSRFIDIASTNFSFGGLTQQTPASTQANIEAAAEALRRDNETVTPFSVRSTRVSTTFVPCPDEARTCTCGEICVPNTLVFGSAFSVTAESYIAGASAVALSVEKIAQHSNDVPSFVACGCFASTLTELRYSSFLGNDFTSTLRVQLDPLEPSASLWSGISMVVPPTPSAFIPLGSGTLVADLRFGVEYVLRGEMFSRPRFRVQGKPPLLITGTSKKFQRLTCASSLQVPIWNSTLCGLCPTYAKCDGTRNMTTSVAAWRPQLDVLPLQKCAFISDGCASGGDGTSCEIGFESTLCGGCASGFGRGWGKCEKCPAVDAESQLTVALIVVAALLYICFVAYSALSRVTNYPILPLQARGPAAAEQGTPKGPAEQSGGSSSIAIGANGGTVDGREGEPGREPRPGWRASLKAWAGKVLNLALPLAVSLKIITNHMAMMGLIGAAAVRPLPSSASSATTTSFFSIQNVIGNLALFDTVSMDCAVREIVEGPERLIVVVAVFVGFPILGALAGVFMRSISCLRSRTIWKSEDSLGFGLLPLVATMFAVVRVLQPSVVEYSAKLLPCTKLTFYDSAEYLLHQLGQLNGTVPAPKLQLSSSPEYRSLSCVNGDGSWPKYRIGAMICLAVVGFGIPLLLALLVRAVQRGKESGSYCPVVFSYFMKNFRPETYLWEFVLMLRLAVGWGILALFQEDRLQFSVLMMYLALFWVLHAHAAPYRTFRWNACEHLTYSAAIITLNCYDAVTTYAHELSEAKASGAIIDEGANLFWQRTFELISTVIQMVALAAVILGAIPREWHTCCRNSEEASQTEDSQGTVQPEGAATRSGEVSTSYGAVHENSATLLRETERSEEKPPERHSTGTRNLISSNFRFRRRTGEFTGASVNEDHPTMELALLVAKMNDEDHGSEARGDSSASSAHLSSNQHSANLK